MSNVQPKLGMVISDLHIKFTNPKNRFDYLTEIKEYFDHLVEMARALKITHIILLGDIFDRGVSKGNKKAVKEIFYWIEMFNRLALEFEVHSVIGNHELTYHELNPFYTLKDSAINTSEIVQIADSKLVFKHHNNADFPAFGDFLFMHESVASKEVDFYFQDQGIDLLSRYIKHKDYDPRYKRFKGVFNGHMHLGDIMLEMEENGTMFYQCPSVGRVSTTEVRDDMLSRKIFVIDFQTKDVQYFEMDLLDRASTLKEDIVIRDKKKYEDIKTGKYLKSIDVEECFEEIRSNDPIMAQMLDYEIKGEVNPLYLEVVSKAEDILGGL